MYWRLMYNKTLKQTLEIKKKYNIYLWILNIYQYSYTIPQYKYMVHFPAYIVGWLFNNCIFLASANISYISLEQNTLNYQHIPTSSYIKYENVLFEM